MTFEWTELTYQTDSPATPMFFIFPLCVLLVFLVLAAQYESCSLPFAVILIVPMTLLSAIGGVWLRAATTTSSPRSACRARRAWRARTRS